MKKFLFVVMSLMLVLSLAACGEEPGESKDEVKVLGIGEKWNNGTFEYSVTDVKKIAKWNQDPDDGEEYIAIEVEATNVSSKTAVFSSTDIYYYDNEELHRKYNKIAISSAKFETGDGVKIVPDNSMSTEDVEPGATVKGFIVYEMNKDASEVEIWYRTREQYEPEVKFRFTK